MRFLLLRLHPYFRCESYTSTSRCCCGEHVAVKIRCAGLRELFDVDLNNLKVLSRILDKFYPNTDVFKLNWIQFYDESAERIYE